MASRVNWIHDLKQALERARKENTPVLLDFFNPG
jgi:uncharacterized protein YyaL (SSP411 family)